MIFFRKHKLFWVNLTLTGALIFGAPVFVQGAADHSGEGQIHKPAYDITTGPGTEGFMDDSTDNTYGYYTIMGTTTVTLEEMTDLYETQGAEYPRSLKEGGAETIEDFCSIILEEAEEEGVRAEVVYVQAMLETGWLQFGGDAVESQFNFSGLGTTGGGVQGNSYPDVRTGIRAQVQHLKAYASTEELSGNCVDSRFDMVKRGSAPYVEWLGIQENPNGGGWAAGAGYGEKLRKLLTDLKEE
nr:glucosaminidase domain-containing protein [uncultured Blautia sp.]